MAKGDFVRVTYKTGVGVETEMFSADANGRKFEVTSEKQNNLNWIFVREFTRGGTEVRKAQFRAEDVTAIRHDQHDRRE